MEYMDTHSRILELANNSEIENSRNKSHAKISEFKILTEKVFFFSFYSESTHSFHVGLEGAPVRFHHLKHHVILKILDKV